MKFLSNALLILTICSSLSIFMVSCDKDSTEERIINIIEPAAETVLTSGSDLNMHVLFEHTRRCDVAHFNGIIITNSTTGEKVYNFSNFVSDNKSYEHQDTITLNVSEQTEFVIEARTSGTDFSDLSNPVVVTKSIQVHP